MKHCTSLLALAILALCTSAFAQMDAPAAEAPGLVPLSELRGIPVVNDAQASLGEVSDLLVEARSGEIRYAVIDTGSYIGMGENLRVIPWYLVKILADEKPANTYHALTQVTLTEVKAAPLLPSGQIQAAELDRAVESVFGLSAPWSIAGSSPQTLIRLSHLSGVVLLDSTGGKAGTLTEIILAPADNYVVYAVLDTSKDAAVVTQVPVLWQSLSVTSISVPILTATMPVANTRFAEAPKYDGSDWRRMSSANYVTEVGSYYGADPYWQYSRFKNPNSNRPAEVLEAAGTRLVAMTEDIVGLEVHDDADKNLGEIRDVLFDSRSGEIYYAVIGVGGLLGMGETLHIIPWRFIQITGVAVDSHVCTARTSLTEAQVKSAPQCEGQDAVAANVDRQVELVFGIDAKAASRDDTRPNFARLSQLDGTDVLDPMGRNVGEIDNVVLAPQNNCIAFVVMETTEIAGDRNVAIPVGCMAFNQVGNAELTATTTVSLDRFLGAPQIDEDNWTHLSSQACLDEMAAYYGCPQYWTNSRFAMARQAPADRP